MQQLQEKRAVEHLHQQLVLTSGLVKTLEVHHVAQSQQIEANLQKALEVYEQARVMRTQQKTLQNVSLKFGA